MRRRFAWWQSVLLMLGLVFGSVVAEPSAAMQYDWHDVWSNNLFCYSSPSNTTLSFELLNDSPNPYTGTYSINKAEGPPTDPLVTAAFTIEGSGTYQVAEMTVPNDWRGIQIYLYISFTDGSFLQEALGTCGSADVTKTGSVAVSTSDSQPLPAGLQVCFDDSCGTYGASIPTATSFTHQQSGLTPGKTYAITVKGATGYQNASTSLTMPEAGGAATASTSIVLQPAVVPQIGSVIVMLSTADGQELPASAEVCVDSACLPLGDYIDPGQTAKPLRFDDLSVGPHNVTVTAAAPYSNYSGTVMVVAGETITHDVVLAPPPTPNQSALITFASSRFMCGDDIHGVQGQFMLSSSADQDIDGEWVITDAPLGLGVVGAEGLLTIPAGTSSSATDIVLSPYFLGRVFYLHVEFDDGTQLDREMSLCGEQVEVTKSIRVMVSTADNASVPAGTEICLESDCITLATDEASPYMHTWSGLTPDTEYQVSISSAAPYGDHQDTVRTSTIASPLDPTDTEIVLQRDTTPVTGEVTISFDTVDSKPIPRDTVVCVDDVCVDADSVLAEDAPIFSHLIGVFAPGPHTVKVTGTTPYIEVRFPFDLAPSSSTGFEFTLQLPDQPGPVLTYLYVTFDVPEGGPDIVGTGFQIYQEGNMIPILEGEVEAEIVTHRASLVLGVQPHFSMQTGTGVPVIVADLTGLPAGQYRLELAPEGYEPVSQAFTLTDGNNEFEIKLQLADIVDPEPSATAPTATATVTPTATVTATATPTATSTATPTPTSTSTATTPTPTPETPSPSATPTGTSVASPTPSVPGTTPNAGVSDLPKTGAGEANANASWMVALAAVAAATVAIGASLIVERRR